MRHVVFVLALLLALALTLALASAGETESPSPLSIIDTPSEQVVRGAELYDWNCAVCHGDTALGYAEAKLAFPEDHRHCTRCHKPNNPATMGSLNITPHNAFSIGEPPALRGEGTLEQFPNALVLYHYIRAAMPRYEPGRLSDQEYLDITAFLLAANNVLPKGATVTEEEATGIILK